MTKARKMKRKAPRKPSRRSKSGSSKGSLKLHGDKLAHAVRAAAGPSRRGHR